MEVIGVVASIIGIGGAVERSLSVISKIRQHFAADHEIKALQDDLVRLNMIVNRLQHVTTNRSFKSNRNLEAMQILVNNCCCIIQELVELLESCQRWQKSGGKSLLEKRLVALTWGAKRMRITFLQQQIRDLMAEFNLYLTTAQINGPMMSDSESRIGIHPPRASPPISEVNRNVNNTTLQPLSKGGVEISCRPSCFCNCHETFIWTFRLLYQWLGSLSFSMTGSIQCYLCVCQTGQMSVITYYCPRWLALRGLFISVTNGERLQLCISLPRLVAADSSIFRCIRQGDSGGIKQLLTDGKASIADVSAPYGHSTLTTALLYKQADVVRFLLGQGASQVVSDGSWTLNPHSVFNHFLSCSLVELNISASDTISDLVKFLASDWLKDTLRLYTELNILQALRLSRLHKAVVGISCEDVSALAITCKDIINKPDVSGRTALFWATVMEDEPTIRTLLFHGAEPKYTRLARCLSGTRFCSQGTD
jgi:hypothetical protein